MFVAPVKAAVSTEPLDMATPKSHSIASSERPPQYDTMGETDSIDILTLHPWNCCLTEADTKTALFSFGRQRPGCSFSVLHGRVTPMTAPLPRKATDSPRDARGRKLGG